VEQAPPPPDEPPPPPPDDPPPPPDDPSLADDGSAGSVDQAAPDESPVRPGQPGFGDDDAGSGDQSPVQVGQPGFDDNADLGDQSPVQVGQPGFDDNADLGDQSPVQVGQPGFDDGSDLGDQSPVPPGQPGFGDDLAGDLADASDEDTDAPVDPDQLGVDPLLEQDGFVFQPTDMSTWTTPGLPDDWTDWISPVTPSPDSWTDDGYSTDWGVVQPEWAVGGEDPFPTTQIDHPLSGVFGPGHAADVHWAYQGQTQYCGLYSVRTILHELGRDVDMDEMVHRAATNGWFVYDAHGQVEGIRPRDIDDILASYGVGSHQFGGPDQPHVADRDAWQALNTALANNERVVVGVDGREFDQGHDVGTPGALDMDHFVAVTGVDYSRGVVILQDSARKAGLEVPLDVFINSWRDSNFSLTATDASMPGDGTSSIPADADSSPDHPGVSIVGTTLHPEPSDATGPVDDPTATHVDDPAGPPPEQHLGQEHQPGEEAAHVIRAEAPEAHGADDNGADGHGDAAGLHGDGIARPTALLGDLAPAVGNIDLSSVGKSLDLGMADNVLDSVMPHGVADGGSDDGGFFDDILDLLKSVDDAIADLGKQILSMTTHVGGIRR
jgi:hypothetical protein